MGEGVQGGPAQVISTEVLNGGPFPERTPFKSPWSLSCSDAARALPLGFIYWSVKLQITLEGAPIILLTLR